MAVKIFKKTCKACNTAFYLEVNIDKPSCPNCKSGRIKSERG